MRTSKHKSVLLGLCLLVSAVALLAVADCPDPLNGLRGTVFQPQGDGDGIGGTGKIPRDGGDGIGGTGFVPVKAPKEGETLGLYGTIDAIGSICVNGVRVEFTDNTPVTLGAGATSTDKLAVGQVVGVTAQLRNGKLNAKSIQIHPAVNGPVQKAPKNGTMRVFGKNVILGPNTIFPAGTGRDGNAANHFPAGGEARVFGYRNAKGAIIATRVDYDGVHKKNVAYRDLPTAFAGKANRVAVQGFAESRSGGHIARIAGHDFALDDATRVDGADTPGGVSGRRVLVVGSRLADGAYHADRIIIIERPEDRLERKSSKIRIEESGKIEDERLERTERTDRDDRSDRSERAERAERAERPERAERAERPERAERAERPERADRAERPERADRAERPERADRAERAERPDRSGRQ